MPSFGQQQPTSTLLSHPNRLSNPFQSGSCQRKSCSASQTGLCVSEVDLGLFAWTEEGGVAKSPAGALFRVALWAQQAAVSLNNPAMVWPDRHYTASQWNHHAVSTPSIGFRFHGDLMVQSVCTHPKHCYTLIHWSRERGDSKLLKNHLPLRMMFHINCLSNIIKLWSKTQMYIKDTMSTISICQVALGL